MSSYKFINLKIFCPKHASPNEQRGSIIIYTVLILIAVMTISFALMRLFLPKFKVVKEAVSSSVAFYAADSAMEWCLYSNRSGSVPIPPPPGIVGWWKFDETFGTTAADSSGSSNTGTLTGSPGPFWTTGQVNGGLDFDGVNDYVDASIGASITDIRVRTVSAWIKLDSFGELNLGRIVDKRILGGWTFMVNNSEITNGLGFNQDFTTVIGRWAVANVLTIGPWYHVAVVYDSNSTSNVPTFYVNGTAFAITNTFETPSGSYISDATSSLRIGGRDSATRLFDGLIDDVRVYNQALTQTEITDLFNYTEPPPSADAPPQPTISISTTTLPISYQIYRGSNISVCPVGESIDYRTVGNYRGISRSLEVF